VGVEGFWFGFALRCAALLCGVFVRLHLALFPAGGPFLSSLSVNLCTNWAGPACTTLAGCLAGPRCAASLFLCRGGLRLSAVACLPVALADLCGFAWSLPRVSVSCVACVCLCLASALCLSAPMLLGVSLVSLYNTVKVSKCQSIVISLLCWGCCCTHPWVCGRCLGRLQATCVSAYLLLSPAALRGLAWPSTEII
jgi:hypothetical protein